MELIDAHEAAAELKRLHGLKGWLFTFDGAVRRFGSCDYNTKTITLSRKLTRLNDEATVRNVVLHEIAHALAGPRAGHGPAWRAQAEGIGCDARRCCDEEVSFPPAKFKGTCPSCGTEALTFRRRASACLRCCKMHNRGRFSEEYLFRWQAL